MNDLRTSLHRVADAVEPLPLDDDLWQRGVASRRRGQALVVAAVLAIIASVTWSAVLLDTGDREARTASTDIAPEGAIPRAIVDIPDDLDATTDLAVGRASAAFVSGRGEPVVVTAADGVPRRLDLGDWGPDRAAFALSPDGRLLAYQQPAAAGTQLVVLDLETGLATKLLVNAGDPLEVDGIGWSPDSTEVGWVASAMGSALPMAGRARVDGSGGARVIPPANISSVALGNNGTAVLGRVSGRLFLWDQGSNLEPLSPAPQAGVGAFSPDGRYVSLATSPDTSSYTLDLDSRQVLEHPFPEGTLGDAVVRPLGWIDDRLQVLYVEEAGGADSGELVVTTPEVDGTSTWRRSVGVVEAGPAASLSLAVDLIPDLDGSSSQPLTYDFPPPAERDISWIIGLGVAAAIAVLMALRWLWRRFVSLVE